MHLVFAWSGRSSQPITEVYFPIKKGWKPNFMPHGSWVWYQHRHLNNSCSDRCLSGCLHQLCKGHHSTDTPWTQAESPQLVPIDVRRPTGRLASHRVQLNVTPTSCVPLLSHPWKPLKATCLSSVPVASSASNDVWHSRPSSQQQEVAACLHDTLP